MYIAKIQDIANSLGHNLMDSQELERIQRNLQLTVSEKPCRHGENWISRPQFVRHIDEKKDVDFVNKVTKCCYG